MAKLMYRLLSMLVTASMERLAAVGTRSLAGTWPGEDSDGKEGKKA